jgi:hypothetical protein
VAPGAYYSYKGVGSGEGWRLLHGGLKQSTQ